MRNRITRISHIDRLPRLIIIRHQLHVNRDLIIRGAAEIGAQGRHGGVDIVEADIIRRDGGAAIVLGEPEAHDAPGAWVGPVPLAGRGGGVGHGGAGVVDDGDAVFPGDVVAGTVIEELGAVGGGGGDEGDGAVAGVVGGKAVFNLDGGTAWVRAEGKCKGKRGGEEYEGDESKAHGVTHIVVLESMCLGAAASSGCSCRQGVTFKDVDVVKGGDLLPENVEQVALLL